MRTVFHIHTYIMQVYKPKSKYVTEKCGSGLGHLIGLYPTFFCRYSNQFRSCKTARRMNITLLQYDYQRFSKINLLKICASIFNQGISRTPNA